MVDTNPSPNGQHHPNHPMTGTPAWTAPKDEDAGPRQQQQIPEMGGGVPTGRPGRPHHRRRRALVLAAGSVLLAVLQFVGWGPRLSGVLFLNVSNNINGTVIAGTKNGTTSWIAHGRRGDRYGVDVSTDEEDGVDDDDVGGVAVTIAELSDRNASTNNKVSTSSLDVWNETEQLPEGLHGEALENDTPDLGPIVQVIRTRYVA
jgi:hypothetical protein